MSLSGVRDIAINSRHVRHRRDCVRCPASLAWTNAGDLVLLYGAFALDDGVLFARSLLPAAQAGPDLVADRGWPLGHRCWCRDRSVS